MTTSFPAPRQAGQAYKACIDLAFLETPRLISRWCGRLVERLYEHSLQAQAGGEKHALHEAVSALKKHMSAIEQGFGPALQQAVAEEAGGAAAGPRAGAGAARSDGRSRSFSSLSFDDLELMGDSQVQDTIDSARVQQITRLACESGLADFSARLSTAQGFAVVKSDRNPLRPEVFAQTLIGQLQALQVGNASRARWLTHGAQLLGEELQSLYILLAGELSRAGVMPAAYNVILAPEDRVARGRAGAEPAQAAPSAEGGVLTLDHLHRLLVGEYDESLAPSPAGEGAMPAAAQDPPSAPPATEHAVPTAMDLLAGLKEKGLAAWQAMRAAGGATAPQPEPEPEPLAGATRTLGQSLALEVTGMMMAQMSGDERLLPGVRQFITDIEPAFLRLAVVDPRFFGDKAHPARRLLEAVTGKSLGFASEQDTGFAPFLQDLHGMADALQDDSGTATFARLLAAFEQQEAALAAQTAPSQGRAVQALLQAEQRNLLAEKIAVEIQSRSDWPGDNRVIAAFITGPWAQVMARERLLGEHGGPGSRKSVYSLTLGDVLWSVNVEQAARHRTRLLRLIPGMLASIRDGLLSIDYPIAQATPFFDELMAFHEEALKPDAERDPKALRRSRLERDFEAGDQRFAPHWMAPDEAHDSGFIDDLGVPTGTGFAATEPMPFEPERGSDPAQAGEHADLRLGDWVELQWDQQWLRAQLTWLSPHATLFMFTSQGGRQHSMTLRVLQHLLQAGLVRVVSQRGLVNGALDTVARAAMQNSVRRSQP